MIKLQGLQTQLIIYNYICSGLMVYFMQIRAISEKQLPMTTLHLDINL